MPTIYEKLATANISRQDIEAELERLRAAVEREPDLQPLLDNFPADPGADIGLLSSEGGLVVPLSDGLIHTVPLIVLASKVNKLIKYNPGQKGLNARQREFVRAVNLQVSRYEVGDITLDALNRLLREEVKGLHISAAVSGKGFKWADMTFSDWGRVGNALRAQYGFLDRRILAVQEGRTSIAQLRTRLKMFAEAASSSYEKTAVGKTGIPPELLPSFPGAGDTKCYTNCKCWWMVRTLNQKRGDFNVSWRLGKAEHCETCIRRGRLHPDGWGGLKMRGFRWQTLPAPIYRV